MSVIDLTSPEPNRAPNKNKIDENSWKGRESGAILNKIMPVLNNRNTDYRFDLTKKRQVPAAVVTHLPKAKRATAGRRGGKRECSLGAACPYKDEHQHMMEFDHSSSREHASSGSGSRFVGGGNKLGGGVSSGSSAGSTRHRWGSGAGSTCRERSIGSSGTIGSSSGGSGAERVGEEADYVECVVCATLVGLREYDKHLHGHEVHSSSSGGGGLQVTGGCSSGVPLWSAVDRALPQQHHHDRQHVQQPPQSSLSSSSSWLMQQQDEEFEQAELQDLARLIQQREAAEQREQVGHEDARAEGRGGGGGEAGQVIDLEDESDGQEHVDTGATRSLSSSTVPTATATATATGTCAKISLAFRFKLHTPPAHAAAGTGVGGKPGKLVGYFRVDTPLGEVFTFLDSCAALAEAGPGRVRWELRASFGSRTYSRGGGEAARSLQELGIEANTMLVVQEVD